MDQFEEVYDQLRREYLAGADARLAELRAEVESLRAGDREAASRLRARLHRLAGSGGSHGFPGISSAARDAEVMLRERGAGPADADALDDVIDQLAVAYSEAEIALRSGQGLQAGEPMTRDPITSLLDLDAFVSQVSKAVAHAQRGREPLAVLCMKLENFRAIREQYGEATTNDVLAHAASVVRTIVRASDPVAHAGEGMFAIMLERAGAEGGRALALKLEKGLAARPFETPEGGTIRLRAQAANAVLGPDGTSADAILRAAGVSVGQEE
ncbi:MAG TPA: diguanylate cyclase [Gemmatimonadales bacterium]|nr:diguanylate cyclase [Gemmatimonadales bacterium]